MFSPVSGFLFRACAICGLAFPIAARAVMEADKSVSVAVVHNWGDLMAQKAVSLANMDVDSEKNPGHIHKEPIAFRFGVDQVRSKIFGGVVLYCFAQAPEGDSIEPGAQRDGSTRLGPFEVSVQELRPTALADVAKVLQAQAAQRDGTGARLWSSRALFLKTISFDQKGSYLITVRQPAKEGPGLVVAKLKVEVSPERENPWVPLRRTNDDQPQNQNQDAWTASVSFPATGAEVPKWNGSRPLLLGDAPDAKGALPAFIPADPDPGIQLSVKAGELVVKLDHKAGLTDFFPEDHFLVRWWVNGKPWVPKADMEREQFGENWSGQIVTIGEVHFRMAFLPEVLGAKKGDRVAVQLLYCPGGIEYPGPAQAQAQLAIADDDSGVHLKPVSALTNRVEFIYSGDPKSMAAP